MTADIIPLRGPSQDETEMHLSGKARCLDCGSEWVAVAPVGTCYLECPQCKTVRGVLRAPIGGSAEHGEGEWTCNCGCDVFKILGYPGGSFRAILCMRCGAPQQF